MARYNKHGRKRRLILAGIVCAALAVYYLIFYWDPPDAVKVSDDLLQVHMIDVGQGDAFLIRSPSGDTMLIDCGPEASAGALRNYLARAGVRELTYLVLTHPHEDHIGGWQTVFSACRVGTVVLSNAVTTTPQFTRLLEHIEQESIPVLFLKGGDSFQLGDIAVDLLGPVRDDYENLNDSSLVLRLTYGSSRFLFMGDAEEISEQDMLSSCDPSAFRCDVLKIGHHGSSSSTSEAFLDAVHPAFALISCGKDNDFGHPHRAVLNRLKDRGVTVFRTDVSGSVILVSDGETVRPAA